MRRCKAWIVLLFSGLILLSIEPAAARAEDKRFSVMLLAGFQSGFRFGELVPLPNTADVPDVKILLEYKSPVWGVGFGYQINRSLELQVGALYNWAKIMEDVGIGLAGVPLGKSRLSEASHFSAGGGLLYYFTHGRFSPYIAAGGGISILDTEKVGSKAKPYCRLGAGVRVRLTDSLRAVLDIHDSITFFRFDRDFEYVYIQIYSPEFKGIQHSPGFFLGLGYVF